MEAGVGAEVEADSLDNRLTSHMVSACLLADQGRGYSLAEGETGVAAVRIAAELQDREVGW